MRRLLKKLASIGSGGLQEKLVGKQQIERQVKALYSLLRKLYGNDKLALYASKVDALDYMRSDKLGERVLGLERFVFQDPSINGIPSLREIPSIITDIEEEIADVYACRTVEDKLEKMVAKRMQERHDEYIKEVKLQILQENNGPDNARTLKKYAELERLEHKVMSKSALDRLRPTSIDEVIGQDGAIKALFSKIVSPYPRHVILYGPPGVGKTTVARLALERARQLPYTPFDEDARFVEVDATTLRWDPREVSNPLLGSVHDPIYQGAKRELAENAIPEPKTGLVTEAHGGILFIDEIGELDPILQSKLLKVLEDKRVRFDSAYYDPDAQVPKYIKKLFEEGAPADFILIGATTKEPRQINPALRSRVGEVFFQPLTPAQVEDIVRCAAAKLQVELDDDVPGLISKYTMEGRKATSILTDAYGLVLHRNIEQGPRSLRITSEDVYEVAQISRLQPAVVVHGSNSSEIGKIFGVGVSGFLGSILEIEAVAFPAEGDKGQIRFNETSGSMAKDSVFNAFSLVRKLTGKQACAYDIHVNIVGGAQVDGPSAGAAILFAVISAIEKRPVVQNVAITGEVSIQGRVKPVGGIIEKIHAARQSGMRKLIIPAANRNEIPADLTGIQVVPVDRVDEIFQHVFTADSEDSQHSSSVLYGMPLSRNIGYGASPADSDS